jgi:ABC-type bacteriocin/lantibiotic exporter with double-glycine peptidase domain
VSFAQKVSAQLSSQWPKLSIILILELFSIPLALLAPLGIKIAIDCVIAGKPFPLSAAAGA